VPDGKERPVACEGKTVWLHPECQRFYFQSRTQRPDREAPSPYEVLGPAPVGQKCINCGGGIGAIKRIKLIGQDGTVFLHVRCAGEYLAALTNRSVRTPAPKGRSDAA
jgi:hypothetical protein